MIDGLRDIVNSFDKDHVVKQIILIGFDGKVKNIELEGEYEGD
jgi:hypothetical protein